ncbi:MAG: ABC transporter permease [Rhodospirillales bacterium]|nr:ABC transporter permease [Rhodospirillales bacterium]
MLRFVVWRLVMIVPVLAVVLVATFLATYALPGDPVMVMLGDHSSNEEMAARLRAEYGLDRPMWKQFAVYVGGILTGDFGMSYRYVRIPVVEVLQDGLKISPLLALAALGLGASVGTLAGVIAAIRRNTATDTAIILVLVAGLSIPNFAVATFLVYAFAIKLGVLPVAGWGRLDQTVLPVLILTIPSAAYIARLTRTFMLEVLGQDYIRTARAKGLSEPVVILRHALRNIMVPLLTSMGIIFGGLISGTFVVETIFNIPGLGRMAIDSVFARDYPVAMAIVMLFTAFFVLINLLVDVAYAIIDPRIRQRMVPA